MKKTIPWKHVVVLTVLLLPAFATAQENYRFERMWPVLKQPWYFFKPSDVAKDFLGNIYVTDWGHNRVLKFTQDGSFVTSWGKEGTGSGEFEGPRGITTHEETINDELLIYVYVIDGGNNRVAKFTSDGSLIWQRSVLREPGEGALWLNRIVLDAEGYIYITDYTNNCVKKLSEGGGTLTTINKWGSQLSGDFKWPCGIAVDTGGNIYVADNGNDRIQKINQNDNTISPWYGFGPPQAEFDEPFGIALDDTQNIYVTNNGNGLIQKFSPDGSVASWQFDGEPDGIAVVPAGYIYVLEWTENTEGMAHKRIVKLSPEGNPLAIWASEGEDNGKFNQPYGISFYEEAGETFIYVSDTFNNRIQKFSSKGKWIQTWGAPDWAFNYPEGIAVDDAGSIYVADENNHLIRKINPDGSSSTWSLGATYYPYGVAVEQSGLSIYVAAREGILFYRILKINTETGYFSIWGSGFNQPHGVTVGFDGYVYVADTGNNAIKKCDASGICTTCGSGLNQPLGVAVDSALNVYVADTGNDRIKIFDQDCIPVATLGGPGSMPGQFSFPTNLAAGSDGKIYVSDTGNNRIQVFGKFEVLSNSKAIIVAGGGPYPGNNLWDATQATANFAYRTLIYRGFTDADINYLSSDADLDLDNDGTPEVDGLPTIANLQSAITEWAINENAESLTLYLDDHGGTDTFSLSRTEKLEAGQLADCLDAFEAGTSGKVAVIYEACESGSFMDNLQGDGRIIITSTLPGEQAKFLSQGALSFSSFFWTHILNGLSIGDSYLKAVDIVNFAFSNQNPQLTGDAQNIYIGGGVSDIIGEAPAISSVSEPQEIADEEKTSALLSAEGVTDPDGIARVWAVIWPPDYVPDSSDKPLITLPSCELLPAGGDRYEGTYREFNTDNTYQIAIYAMDRNNNTSLPQLTTVSRNYSVERRAIVIAGGSSANVTRPMIENNVSLAYNALKAQLYGNGDIYFMSPPTALDGIVWDDYPSTDNLQAALNNLATSGDIEHLDLTVYLIGAGNTGTFTMNDESEAEPDILSAAALDVWLDSLQAAKPGRIKIIYDGDKSGSFITSLTPPEGSERIIITSSAEDGAAYFSGAGEICFSSFFWGQVASGATLYNAFSYARQAITYLSLKNEISFSCYPQQNPLLDGDGDGKGNRAADYEIARARTIGIGLKFAADPPAIESASVGEEEGVVTIRAVNITSTSPIQRVWAVIKPLAYCPGDSGEETQELKEVELDPDPEADGSYKGIYTDPVGACKVSVYAMDVDGNTSPPQETKVYQEGGDIYEPDDRYDQANVIVVNNPSPQPHTFHHEGDVDWVKFYGKEGQVYTIEADNLNVNCAIIIELYRKDNMEVPIQVRQSNPGDECLRFEYPYPESDIYYVRLLPLDEYCTWGEGISYSYDLSVYDNNLGLTALVAGKVRDSVSGTPIDGAVITSNGIGATISTRGEYIFSEVPGHWNITARKGSYATSRYGISIEADEEYIRRNIGMYPITGSGCVTAADCDDGIFCNGSETCVDQTCQAGTDPCPDDGIFCNGEETCSEENGSCGHAGNPCLAHLTCDEERDACLCLEDGDCDDGFYCTGIETCLDGACQQGTDPCPEGVTCDEDVDECLLPTLEVIPRAIMQSHWMPLPVFMSIRGTHTHFGGTSELTFTPPAVMPLPLLINQETLMCFGLMMPAWMTELPGESLEVSVTTGSENATGSVEIWLLPFMMREEGR